MSPPTVQPIDKGSPRAGAHQARALRTNATPPERLLWRYLSNRQLLGIRFNRQVTIGPYICDFAARTEGIVVELDGGQHAERVKQDERRTRFLQSQGYHVLRFWNDDVLGNVVGVVEVIEEVLRTRVAEGAIRIDRPSPGPSRKREGSSRC